MTLQHLLSEIVPDVAIDLVKARVGFDVDEIARSQEIL